MECSDEGSGRAHDERLDSPLKRSAYPDSSSLRSRRMTRLHHASNHQYSSIWFRLVDFYQFLQGEIPLTYHQQNPLSLFVQ